MITYPFASGAGRFAGRLPLEGVFFPDPFGATVVFFFLRLVKVVAAGFSETCLVGFSATFLTGFLTVVFLVTFFLVGAFVVVFFFDVVFFFVFGAGDRLEVFLETFDAGFVLIFFLVTFFLAIATILRADYARKFM